MSTENNRSKCAVHPARSPAHRSLHGYLAAGTVGVIGATLVVPHLIEMPIEQQRMIILPVGAILGSLVYRIIWRK
jgi:hypothetical protein